MEYKEGDLIYIKEGLVADNTYGNGLFFAHDMKKFRGRTIEVDDVIPKYRRDEIRYRASGWVFNNEMINHKKSKRLNQSILVIEKDKDFIEF